MVFPGFGHRQVTINVYSWCREITTQMPL